MQNEIDNSWYENGELPPVGAICEYKLGNFWKHCEVKGDAFDYGHRIVLVQIGEGCKATGEVKYFRPTKSDREKAIEDMLKIAYTPEVISNRSIMGAIYDAGYRKVEDK
jgi:hypothetical protein